MKKITISVCSGNECVMMGAMDIIESIESLKSLKQQLRLKAQIEVKPCKCLQGCKDGKYAPIVQINEELVYNATSETVMSKIIALVR